MARKKIEMPKLKKLSVRTLEGIRKDTCKYIYVKDKDGNAKCDRCGHEYVLPKTKHLQDYKCPRCKKNLKIMHLWRKNGDSSMQWRVLATVLDDSEIVFRYIMINRNNGELTQLQEVAREVINLPLAITHYYENPGGRGNWYESRYNFFREWNMGTYRSNLCCLQANVYNYKTFINEIKKIDRLKYIDFTDIAINCFSIWYIAELITRVYRRSLLYEQLQKTGYSNLVISDLNDRNYYLEEIQYDESKKSLSKKLGLTEDNFKRLKEVQTLANYKILLAIPNITDEDLKLVDEFGYDNFIDINKTCKIFQLKRGKTIQYIRKQVISNDLRVTDYVDYLRLIDKLNYPIDNRYAYPKDFRAFKQVIVKRYNEHMDRIRNMTPKELAIEEAKKDKKMYLISKALRENKELRSWFEGADGLKVFVPESVGELVDSGVNLHNCLGNYADKIVSNVSILFFIRRIDEPDKDYIAMEYRYGKVNQLRLDDNVEVKDAKIINFAEALARKLNEINANEKIIATAIREVA